MNDQMNPRETSRMDLHVREVMRSAESEVKGENMCSAARFSMEEICNGEWRIGGRGQDHGPGPHALAAGEKSTQHGRKHEQHHNHAGN